MTKIISKGKSGYVRGELTRLIKPKDLQEGRENGKTIFTFTWLLKRPMRLILDMKKEQLLVPNILEDVSPGSAIYADVLLLTRKFSAGREELLELGLLNKGDSVSVVCKPKHNDYTYATEKILKLVNDIFQRIFERYPNYTEEKFNQVMVNLKIRGLDHGIPVVLTPYQEGIEKTHPYHSPGSWDLATLPNSKGEYYYEQGDFFLGSIAGVDNTRLPILGFKDWYTGHYKIIYPLYKDLKKEGDITYHTLAGLDLLDLSEVHDSFQKAISIIKEYLLRIGLSYHEKRKIESRLKELPSHPVELYFKYFALKDAADFIFRMISEKSGRSLGIISHEFANFMSKEDKKQLKKTADMLLEVREQRDSAASYDESLRHILAFREAVNTTAERKRATKVVESNVRNISRSGGGKSVYLGKEELKWIQLGEKALVKIVEYEPFRCRVEIYPI